MDSVRSRQAAAFKADAAQVGVGFNHPFQRRRHHVLPAASIAFFALFNQRVVAQFSQRQRRLGAFSARHGGRAAAGAGTRFKTRSPAHHRYRLPAGALGRQQRFAYRQ